MWFDVRRALAEIKAEAEGISPAATIATSATQQGEAQARVAIVASVAGQAGRIPQLAEAQAPVASATPSSRAPDPEAYARHLRDNGPSTYGAAAAELGWGATRAWQAEARLRAAGRIRFDHLGKAHLVEAAVHGPALASAADVNSNT